MVSATLVLLAVIYFITFPYLPSSEIVRYSMLFLVVAILMIAMMVIGIIFGIREFMGENKKLKTYADLNPLFCKRVVRDGYDGPEYLISGPLGKTFKNACQEQWQFKKTEKREGWIIKDERGNDITDASLESYDGIAIIVSTYSTESSLEKSKSDTVSEFTSIDEGVEYYD